YKTNVDFAISFDLDVIKVYEDFDRMERLAYGKEPGNEKKVAMAKRVYDLCQIGPRPQTMPFQPAFRHLCNILQAYSGDIATAEECYRQEVQNERDHRRFTQRSRCALFWLNNYAPEDFKFKLNTAPVSVEISPAVREFVLKLRQYLSDSWEQISSDQELHQKIYDLMKESQLTPAETFKPLYQLLISKDMGPKLAGFIRILGKDIVINLLNVP
ncbi:MAG: lysine--tRNA ligase, partial [Pseudomonadota bacterium]